jgi:H+/Cl- antiporter ClcA
MGRKALEESVLFASVVKWLLLASFAGVLVGAVSALFLRLLDMAVTFTTGYRHYYMLLPAALFISSLMVTRLSRESAGYGTEKVIEAVHRRSGRIDISVVPVKLAATILTIAFGGSAGRIGPCGQIGGALCSGLSDLLKFDPQDRKKLVICGVSAGFAAVFGAPMAGAIFGIEVLFMGSLLYDVLLPSFVAGMVSYQVATVLGVSHLHETITFIPTFSSSLLLEVCLSGVLFGLCSFLFIEILRWTEKTSLAVPWWPPLKSLAGGAVLVILAALISTENLGLGLDTLKNALHGNHLFVGTFLLKMIFTAVTLHFGGSGGIILPILVIGAAAGNALGFIVGGNTPFFAAVGMASLLAGAANTPIAASILVLELFGASVAPYAATACIISFLMTGHRSVFPSQILSTAKSASLVVGEGREISDVDEVQFKPRPKSISGSVARKIERLKHRGTD